MRESRQAGIEGLPEASPSGSLPGVSVIVVAQDEEHAIADCLASVAWADEVIVLDSGSTDRTVEIARSFTDRVYETDWPGIGIQKNRALSLARGEWVLNLDADERVTPELATEIRQRIAVTDANGFDIPFVSTYLGRVIRHGDWSGESHLRLFRRGHGGFSDDAVHEKRFATGRVEKLEHPIIHHPYASLDEVLAKINAYSTGGAERMVSSGRRPSVLSAIGHAAWSFLWGYVGRAGFLDGREGLVLAVSNANERFYRYMKAVYLNEGGDDHA